MSTTDIKRKRDKQAAIIFGALVVLSLLIGFLVFKLKKPTLDENTLCPINAVVAYHSVVIVDKSDAWDNNDTMSVSNLLYDIYGKIPSYERLTVMVITGRERESTEVKQLFDMCNPGSEKDCNEAYQNCRQIRKRYMESFGGPLKQLNEMLMMPGMSSFSPLFETLMKIIDDNKSSNLNIYLISDLMENGRKFRFYDVVPLSEEIIKEYPIPRNKTKLTIHVHMIERRKHSRELIKAVQSVWNEYFTQQGATIDFQRLLITD